MSHWRATRRRPRSTADGYVALLATGVDETTRRVEEVHRVVARGAFRRVRRFPVVAVVARFVERIHDAIVGGVYLFVRRGSAAGLSAAARAAARHARSGAPLRRAGGVEPLVRAVLNGSHGDFLAATANPLAADLAFHADAGGPALALDDVSASTGVGGRLCVFVHGFGMDERAWWKGSDEGAWAGTYGDRLRDTHGFLPLYVRYNTGLEVRENGRVLADRLQALVDGVPSGVRELVIVGHSMGGLVAHHACESAAARGLTWPGRTRTVITLGTPFGGSPLATAGQRATAALARHPVTAPLAALADARSAGVKDLRYPVAPAAPAGAPAPVAFRFISASLSRTRRGWLGRTLGDGLVPPDSAAPASHPGRAASAHLGGTGHFELLNDPRVYAQIEQWLAAPDEPSPTAPA